MTKHFFWKTAKNIGVMRVFGRALLSRKNCHFASMQKSHTSGEMRFRCDLNGRPSEYFLRIMHRMDDSDYIPLCNKINEKQLDFFLAVSFFYA